jgi:hypothetical protein
MLVRFLELTGTNNGSQLGYLLIDFFRNVDFFRIIVAIFTLLLLVVVVAGGLLLSRHNIPTLTRSGPLWPIIATTSKMHR